MDQATNLRNIIRLQNERSLKSARVITITSGKGGVGKSNTAVNLAVNFAKTGKKVIIFDADFGLANVGVMFGTVPKYNLSDVLFGNMKMKDIICEGPSNIGFISGGSGVTSLNNLNEAQLRRVSASLSQLDDLCDILIVDTGAGVNNQVMDFVLSSPEVLVISTPEPSSITDSYALLKAMYTSPKFLMDTKVYLIANKVESEIEGRAVYDKMNQVVSKFLGGRIEYIGNIPLDSSLEKCVKAQNVVSISAPSAKSAKAYGEISEKLLSDSVETKNKGITRFFGSFIKRK